MAVRKPIGFLIVVALGVAVFMLTEAGDIEPPANPAPTMATLQQIYDKLGDCTVGGRCRVQATGQTECWDANGDPIDCAGTGQDGEYQAGVSMDSRFTDNGDGTATDKLTGRIWLQDVNCIGLTNWTDALSDASTLADGACGLTDGSLPGEWRLPNVREIVSVVDFNQWRIGPPAGHPFPPLKSFPGYRTSTNSGRFPDQAWVLIPGGGQVKILPKANVFDVWPVRGGL